MHGLLRLLDLLLILHHHFNGLIINYKLELVYYIASYTHARTPAHAYIVLLHMHDY